MPLLGVTSLFIHLADTHARDIAHRNSIKTIVTIKTAEMVVINNRPRRRTGLNGRNGLNKTLCRFLKKVDCLVLNKGIKLDSG